jgi:malonate transporter MadL subunit
MVIYGVGILSACLLAGLFLGNLLGIIIGVKANVGGVGIAMLFLILLVNMSGKKFELGKITSGGITFWSAMYIPIVVAMAAKQNVIAAVSGGWLAIIAGALAVAISFALIPVMTKMARQNSDKKSTPSNSSGAKKSGEAS